jgi:O-antigen/teichoic acid export membrane protein
MKIPNNYKKYFINTSWLFLGKFIYAPLSFITGALMMRYLGPDLFGRFSYASSFAGLFSFISFLGLDYLLTRELTRNGDKKDEILGTAFILKIFGSIISILVTFFAMMYTHNDFYTNVLIIIIAFGAIFQTFNVITFYFQANVLSKHIIIPQIFASVIASIFRIMAVYFKLPLVYFAVLALLEYLFLSVGYIIIYTKLNLSILKWRFNKNLATQLLKNSWLLIFVTSLSVIYMRIDQVMIQKMLGNQASGLYASSVKLIEIWYVIPALITDSLFPAIINAKAAGERLFNQRQQHLYNLLAWQGIAIAIPVTIFSKNILVLFYGSDYQSAASALSISIWTCTFVSMLLGSAKFLIADNLIKIAFFSNLTGAVSNVVLNIFLIPKYGINGAAIATLISYFAATFTVILFKKTRHQAFMMLNSLTLGLLFVLINLRKNSSVFTEELECKEEGI